MKRISFNLLIGLLIALSVCAVSAQDNSKVDCPGSSVHVSDEAVTDGDKVTFHVDITGGNVDRSKLEYYWHIDQGRIVSGEGTPVIVVDTSGVGPMGSVTATIDISPYRECEWPASEGVYVRRKGPRTEADLFWEWLWFNGEKAQYAELEENTGIEAEIRERLAKIDPDLTLELGPTVDHGKRQLIVGNTGKPYNKKAVTDFVARAPNFIIFNIVFKDSSIDYPR